MAKTVYYPTPSYLKPFDAVEEQRKFMLSQKTYGNNAEDKRIAQQKIDDANYKDTTKLSDPKRVNPFAALAADASRVGRTNKPEYRSSFTTSSTPQQLLKPGTLKVETKQNIFQKLVSGISSAFNAPKQPLNMIGSGTTGKFGTTKLTPKLATPTVGVGKTGAVQIQPRAYSSADALITGALDSSSLGLLNGGLNKVTNQKGNISDGNHNLSYGAGKLLGYALPYGMASKALKPVTNAITNPLLKSVARVAEGASVFGGGGAIEDFANSKSKREIIKNAKLNALVGGGLGVVGEAIPAIAKGIVNSKTKPQNIQNAFDIKFGKMANGEPLLLGPGKEIKTKPTRGINDLGANTNTILAGGSKETFGTPAKTYAIKNTAIEKAQIEYDNAIQTIQNHFKTNKLTPDEIPRIKSELKIDINKLADNLSNAKTDVRTIGGNARLRRVANADNNASFDQSGRLFTAKYPQGKNLLPQLGNIKKTNVEPTLLKTEKVKIDSNYKNWTGTPKITTGEVKGIKTPINNKLPQGKSTSISSANIEAKAPIKFTKLKPPKQYIPPTDVNGNPLPDPKIISSKLEKPTLKQKTNRLYTATVDNNNPTAKFSKVAKDNTFTLATNSASHKDISNNILDTALVNKEGIKIGKSLKEVLKDMPKDVPMDNEKSFENYLMDKHNISRAREGKPVKPNDSVDISTAKVAATEKLHPEWSAKAKEITTWISSFMDEWGVKAGTLDEGLYNANKKMYPDYVPTNREYSSLELLTKGNGASGYANQTIPIKKATGSVRNIIDPRESIADMVERTVKSAKNNEVSQSIVNSLRSNPEKLKGFAEIVGEPNGNAANVIRVLEKGKPTYVQINDEDFLKNILNLNKTNAGKFERGLRATMNVPKALITHKNPLFGVKNVARDLPTAYVYGSESNPVKFGAKYLKAYYDIATNAKVYQQFKGVGAESGNFFDSGNPSKSINKLLKTDNWFQKGLKAIPGGIEKFNSITESAPRLSEFKTVLKKTGNIDKALFAAKDVTTNFGRNGNFTKHADSGVMYLNAGVQGLDKLARQVKNKPLQTLGKGLLSITAPALALNTINENNPNYQALDNRSKDTYFHIPNPKDGGQTFIKIPKSRELGVIFGSLEERALRMFNGDKKAFKGFANTAATNFSPANPIENNLLAPILINLPKNKDFANRPIVPQNMIQDNRSPNLQFDEKSSELSKWFGNAVKDLPLPDAMKSPKQLDYIMRSYLGGIAQVGLPATTKSLDPSKKPLQKGLDAVKSQFISDPLYSNSEVTDFYDNMDKLKRAASNNNLENDLPADWVTIEERQRSVFTKASTEISDLNKLIKKATDENEIRYYKQLIINLAAKTNKLLE